MSQQDLPPRRSPPWSASPGARGSTMDDNIESIQSICNVSAERAAELLEAASGSVERAIEIHLHSSSSTKTSDEATTKKSPSKRQATLGGFVSPSKRKAPPQTKLDSFFAPRKSSPASSTTKQLSSNPTTPPAASPQASDSPTRASTKPSSKLQHSIKLDTTRSTATPAQPSPLLAFSLLADMFAEMSATTKRTAKLQALHQFLVQTLTQLGGIGAGPRQASAAVLTATLDLILGKLSTVQPGSMNASVLQVSGSAVSTAVQVVTGASRTQLRDAYRQLGDLGDVAAEFYQPAAKRFFVVGESKALSINEVHGLLQGIAGVAGGKGSQKERGDPLVRLLRGAKSKEEICFLVRILLGNMRIGATIKTVVAALASAVQKLSPCPDIKDPAKTLQDVFYVCPRLDRISLALLQGGIPYAVEHCSLEVGLPIQPMLANPAHSLEQVDAFLKAGDDLYCHAVAEWKYDGVRCQAHFDGTSVALFSRHLLANAEQYPDAVEYLLAAKTDSVQSFIIDSEIVGVREARECRDGFRLLPFQELSTRRGTKQTTDVQIRVYSFDLMYLNGESLLRKPWHERQAALREHFESNTGFGFATSVSLSRFDETLIQKALQESVAEGAEGLMIKLTGASVSKAANRYESGTRSQLWLKLKRDYVAGFADTIDVVPIGAWFGNGRKAQKGFLSPVLLAVYDDDEGVFRSISRCMSFSDDMYTAMREFYFHGTPYPPGCGIHEAALDTEDADEDPGDSGSDNDKCGNKPPVVDLDGKNDNEDDRINCYGERPTWIVTNESPTIWFKPCEVFEVAFADLTLSRAHTAAAGLTGDNHRGVALRFPRFKRRRPDKGIEQATTSTEIAQLFHRQVKMK